VTVHAEAVEGLHPATALLQTAEQRHADLVVVGAHGVGGLGMRAGGVAVKVAHHAEIPVVVVPPDPHLTGS
jgi:nucleotide-binding universal stress UspA family protein